MYATKVVWHGHLAARPLHILMECGDVEQIPEELSKLVGEAGDVTVHIIV